MQDSIFNARLFDELEAIFPDTEVNDGYVDYRVAGANGTYAGVHIVISGLTPGIPVTVEINGPHWSYKTFRLHPVPVEVNTGAKLRTENFHKDINANVIRRAPFMVYDVLEPMDNIFIPQFTTAALAFRYPIEYCREKRTQKWEINICHNGISRSLAFYVDEYPLNVPKANENTHKYINWISFEQIAAKHKVLKWSLKFENLLEMYLRTSVYSRQNMLWIPMEEVFELDYQRKPVLNKKHLDTVLRIAKKSGINMFQGNAITLRNLGLSDDDGFYNSLKHDLIESPDEIDMTFKKMSAEWFYNISVAKVMLTEECIPGTGEETLRSICRQINEYLEENNLKDHWIQCCLDEPDDALASVYEKLTGIMREELPGVSIFEPVLTTESLKGTLDIWCPSIDEYEKQREFFDKCVKNGDKLFVYTCLTPGGNYCNRLQDMERLRQVWLGWAPALYSNIQGYLHWGGNYFCVENPFKRQVSMFSEQVLEWHPKRSSYLPAGDSAIFYPGEGEPWVTTRSEAQRIGLEDLCMLEILLRKAFKKAESIVSRAFRGYSDYEKDVALYRELRKELLEEVLKVHI